MSNKPELLLPAGNLEKLKYALAFGADAVYAGVPKFSLRARENQFKKEEDLLEAIEYTHGKGKKIYLTTNILPHNSKILPLMESLKRLTSHHPDAFIISDPGLIMLVRETYPDIEIHLSVQANCVNWASAKFWDKMGVKRLILSRELSIREICEIHQKVPEMELEAFVHGSICVAYSGRCLLSNYFNHRDANQGTCTNSCRWPYHVHERLPGAEDPDDKPIVNDNYKELSGEYYLEQLERPGELMPVDEDEFGTYIMNSKDLMALQYLEELQAAGVRSFKVEGRSKTIYYVSRIASIYRQAIDDLENGLNKKSQLLDDLMEVANRGYTTGFLKSNPLEYGQNYVESRPQSDKIRYAGQIRKFNSAKGEISVDVKNKICVGDKITIISPGQKKKSLEVKYLLDEKDEKVNCVSGGVNNIRMNCSFPVSDHSLITNLVKQPIVTDNTGKELRNK